MGTERQRAVSSTDQVVSAVEARLQRLDERVLGERPGQVDEVRDLCVHRAVGRAVRVPDVCKENQSSIGHAHRKQKSTNQSTDHMQGAGMGGQRRSANSPFGTYQNHRSVLQHSGRFVLRQITRG